MKSIYEYLDYREYLRDDLKSRQARNPRYSMRAMAERLGLNPGTLTRILNGERNISRKMLPRFTEYLRPRSKESEYFETLVRFNQAKDQAEKRLYYGKIKSFRKLRLRHIDADTYRYFENWYNVAVREMLHILPETEDCGALAKQITPPITPAQVNKSIHLLAALGLIRRKGKGWKLSDRLIVTKDEWKSTDIHSFQIAMAELGKQALDRFPKQERDISTFTMGLSQSGFRKVSQILAEARKRILEAVEEDRRINRVYQVNLQLFPLSEKLQIRGETNESK